MYAVLECPFCKEELQVLASSLSRLRSIVARDHLAACPNLSEAQRDAQRRSARSGSSETPIPSPPQPLSADAAIETIESCRR